MDPFSVKWQILPDQAQNSSNLFFRGFQRFSWRVF